MFSKSHLDDWAQEVSSEVGFVLGKKIYQGEYYKPGRVRAAVFAGEYEGKSAVLKLYDDPRVTDEPVALEAFQKRNHSKMIRAPELYRYEIISPHRGWMIVEKLPDGGAFFTMPLSPDERVRFVELYREYRENFPAQPTRSLTLREQLPANELHLAHINRWFTLADAKDAERIMRGGELLLKPEEFLPRYLSALQRIREEFTDRRVLWCHGHFKPHELYRVSSGEQYYLIDFAHVAMRPEGYELAFIIWADHLMHGDWRVSYEKWRKPINDWLLLFQDLPDTLKGERFDALMRVSLLERCLGTILADITAAELPREEATTRISHLYQLVDELLRGDKTGSER